ncbi:hypothetical protein D3C77_580190 [compost metagenome]
MGRAGGIAARVMLAVLPGRGELTAGAGALFIHGAAHPGADVAQQGHAARRLAVRTDHRGMVRRNLHDPFIRDDTAGRAAFAPVKRDTKIRAAGTAR